MKLLCKHNFIHSGFRNDGTPLSYEKYRCVICDAEIKKYWSTLFERVLWRLFK
jgi:hypothetical protein